MNRSDLISKILALTNKHGNEKYFNKLSDMDEGYLAKYVKVVEKLAK